MCQFKYTRHSCGYTLPKLEETHDPSYKLYVPVLIALKYYHDQPTILYRKYLPTAPLDTDHFEASCWY